MIGGLSGKTALFPFQKLEVSCIIHQIKEVIFIYLAIYFLIVHISACFVIGGLKFGMHVTHTGVEGTVSQIFVLCLSFHLMPKNG